MDRNGYEKRIQRVLDHIFANLDGDLSLDTLAEVACMSRFHWHRVFRAMTGETLAETIRRARLHRAASDLLRGDRPVALVAQRCGYRNADSFARAFRTAFGQSPDAFRRLGQRPADPKLRKEVENQMTDVEIVNQPALRVAALRHSGPYNGIGQSFEKFVALATARDLWPQTRGMIGIYCDDPDTVPEEKLTSFAGAVVAADFAMPDDLEEIKLPAGSFALMHYKGPYAGLKGAYDQIFGGWLPDSGQELRDAHCYELSLNDPHTVAPKDLLTDIYVPIK